METNKAYFARKAVNIEELKLRTSDGRDKVPFVVEKVIELTPAHFEKFSQNLLRDFDFIKDNLEFMYIDTNKVWHAVLIKAAGAVDGILCEAEGYNYCRYGNYIPDCSAILEQPKSNITDKIVGQIQNIRAEGNHNLFDTTAVQREAFEKGFNELVVFLEEHKIKYVKYILSGER